MPKIRYRVKDSRLRDNSSRGRRTVMLTFPRRPSVAVFMRWWEQDGERLFREAEAEHRRIVASN